MIMCLPAENGPSALRRGFRRPNGVARIKVWRGSIMVWRKPRRSDLDAYPVPNPGTLNPAPIRPSAFLGLTI